MIASNKGFHERVVGSVLGGGKHFEMHSNLNLYLARKYPVVLLEIENWFLSRQIVTVALGGGTALKSPGMFSFSKFLLRLCFEIRQNLEFPAHDHSVFQ